MSDDVLSMRFDQYQRYRLVADLLESLRQDGRPLRVLDVGGRTALLRRFMKDEVVLVDMEASEAAGLVLGSGSKLPFQDRSFDAVAAFDTLEHVPVPERRAFVAECARVTRRHVLLAGPYEHPAVVEAEELLQRFLLDKLGERHRYLDEHRHHGLPERAEVERQMGELGASVLSIPHANLARWLVCQCLSFYMDYDGHLQGLSDAFHRFYNRELYPNDHLEPVYRYVVVGAFHGAPLPRLQGVLEPAGAPARTIEPFTELARAMMDFDDERKRWRRELEQRETAAADLRAELERERAYQTKLHEEIARLNKKLPSSRIRRLLGD